MATPHMNNGWFEHKRLIEHRLEQLEKDLEHNKKRTNQHEVKLALLGLKVGLLSALMGAAGSIVLQGLLYLASLFGKN